MGEHVPYLIGTMIELPRAALTADEIAATAQFFSFGTNDLTQTTLGLSRDDAGRFLPFYVRKESCRTTLPRARRGGRREARSNGRGRRSPRASGRSRSGSAETRRRAAQRHAVPSVGTRLRVVFPFRVPIARLAAAQQRWRAPPGAPASAAAVSHQPSAIS
jgi:pyruvate,orthophosphate dikinase